jgi:hypothetical protein
MTTDLLKLHPSHARNHGADYLSNRLDPTWLMSLAMPMLPFYYAMRPPNSRNASSCTVPERGQTSIAAGSYRPQKEEGSPTPEWGLNRYGRRNPARGMRLRGTFSFGPNNSLYIGAYRSFVRFSSDARPED